LLQIGFLVCGMEQIRPKEVSQPGLGGDPEGLLGMTEEMEAARRYRLHADELRTIASESFTPKIRATLLQLAVDYDRMARSMEAIDATNRTLRISKSELRAGDHLTRGYS
jgi:hypothetical protein